MWARQSAGLMSAMYNCRAQDLSQPSEDGFAGEEAQLIIEMWEGANAGLIVCPKTGGRRETLHPLRSNRSSARSLPRRICTRYKNGASVSTTRLMVSSEKRLIGTRARWMESYCTRFVQKGGLSSPSQSCIDRRAGGLYTGFSRWEGESSRRASCPPAAGKLFPRVAPSGCRLEFANNERMLRRKLEEDRAVPQRLKPFARSSLKSELKLRSPNGVNCRTS